MDKKSPNLLTLVLVPAILTLVVTVVRLVGELNGWNPLLFGTATAGGGMAIVGIGWLIPIFGLWFGIRLQRSGNGARAPGRSLVICLIAIAAVIGGFFLCWQLDLIWMPDAQNPGEPRGMQWFLGLMGLGVVIAFAAWARVAWLLLVYALLARIPVLAVTWFAIRCGWETHYTKLPPGLPMPAEGELFSILAMPQITLWPTTTILFGTLMAGLGARLCGRGGGGGK
jgi:hypothetical protein